MNKFLKLSGVSILAIIATTNANAAGYTCEELIEYTSCNPGRTLVDGDCVCDAGYYTNGDTCDICQAGTYSSIDSESCTPCPTYTYTNASGQNVTVDATSAAGATSADACYIGPDKYFTDLTGTYHFKSKCSYSNKITWKTSVTNEEECAAVAKATGDNWEWTYVEGSDYTDDDACYLQDMEKYNVNDLSPSYMPQTQSECEEMAGYGDGETLYWADGECNQLCDYMYFGPDGLRCGMI